MHLDSVAYETLRRFGLSHPGAVESLGSAGGFSGARFWRITHRTELLCLRRWPSEHPDARRLAFIHAVLSHAAQRGIAFLPIPIPAANGDSFVSHRGALWELTKWLPGQANHDQPPALARVKAASRAIAQLHRATESFPGGQMNHGPAPGLLERRDRFQQLLAGEFDRIIDATSRRNWPELESRVRAVEPFFRRLAPGVAKDVEHAIDHQVPLQPCARDLRRDHLLFSGDQLTGLVDFGATRWDYAVGDVARLIGSLIADQPRLRQMAIDSYCEIRPLTALDRELIEVYDASNVVLSPVAWLGWLSLENRHFDNPRAVLAQLDQWVLRLEARRARLETDEA